MRTLKERHVLLKSYRWEHGSHHWVEGCASCDNHNPLPPRAQWWKGGYSPECGEEWDCYCRKCALAYCDEYESFDFEEYMKIAEAQAGEPKEFEMDCRDYPV